MRGAKPISHASPILYTRGQAVLTAEVLREAIDDDQAEIKAHFVRYIIPGAANQAGAALNRDVEPR
jgi:hypothetical protein